MFNMAMVKKYIHKIPGCFLQYVKGMNFADKHCKEGKYIVEGDECEKIVNLYKDANKRTFFHEVAHTVLEDKKNFDFVVNFIINNQIIDEFFARGFEDYILDIDKLKNKEPVTYKMIKELQKFIVKNNRGKR